MELGERGGVYVYRICKIDLDSDQSSKLKIKHRPTELDAMGIREDSSQGTGPEVSEALMCGRHHQGNEVRPSCRGGLLNLDFTGRA